METVATGVIKDSGSVDHQYEILNGIDQLLCLKADSEWSHSFLVTLETLHSNDPSADISDLINQHSLGDMHWNWLRKAGVLKTPEHEWFYLVINNSVQSIAIIYHPQKSKLDEEQIIYIDYVAVAPWNRENAVSQRRFSGLGSCMIKNINTYLGRKLQYRPGFSLHSLPQARSYYSHIGMIDFGPDVDKQNMHYFEMETKNAKEFINV